MVLLNLFLVFTFVVLLCVAGFIRSGLEIPVPGSLVRHFTDNARMQGLGIRCGRIHLDLSGGMRMQNLSVLDEHGREIFHVEELYGHIALDHFRSGLRRPDVVCLRNASIILPAYLSEDGSDTAIVQNIDAIVRRVNDSYIVDSLQGQLGGMHISIMAPFVFRESQFVAGPAETGDSARAQPAAEAGEAASPDKACKALSARITGIVSRLETAVAYLQNARNPTLSVRVDRDSVSALMMAAGVTYKDWVIDEPELHFLVGRDLMLRSADIRALRMECHWLRLDEPRLSLTKAVKIPLSSEALDSVQGSVYASATLIEARGEHASGLHSVVSRGPGTLSVDAGGVLEGLPLSFSATRSDDGFIHADAWMCSDLDAWLRMSGVPAEEIHKRVTFSSPLLIQAKADIPAGFDGWNAAFEVEGRGLDVRGMPLDSLYVTGRADGTALFCSSVDLTSGDSHAHGSYFQDFRSGAWRINVTGSIFPPEIGPALGHWWKGIWKEFEFDGPRSSADLVISGNWHNRGSADVWGTVHMPHALYNGVRIGDGHADLWVGDGFVDIYNLDVVSDDGWMKGDLGWLLPRQNEGETTIMIDMDAELPADQLDKAFGSPLASQLPEWTLETVPSLSAVGTVLRTDDGHWSSDLFISGRLGRGAWRGVPFDSMALKVWHENPDTLVRIERAVMLDGGLTGTVDLRHPSGASVESMLLDVDLVGTDLNDSIKALKSIAGQSGESDSGEAKTGKLDASYRGEAKLADIPGTMEGKGKFKIYDSDLGSIKVFGALSSLLKGIGVGYGTFSLTSAHGNIHTTGGKVRFRQTEVDGPAIRIESSGSMGLAENWLDFDVRVYFLSTKSPSLMNVLGVVLMPFGNIFELSLKGTLEEPVWRLKMDPRNLFDHGGDARRKEDAANDDEARSDAETEGAEDGSAGDRAAAQNASSSGTVDSSGGSGSSGQTGDAGD